MDIKMELECNCGNIIEIDTTEQKKYTCSKCGNIVFEEIDIDEEYKRESKRI